MPIRVHEVGAVLALVLALVLLRRLPILGALPLTQVIGVTCFAFAIYLSLQLFNAELARLRAED